MVFGIITLGTNIPTFAYNFSGPRWQSSTIRYYYENWNSARAQSYIRIGGNGWNSTDVNFIQGTASNYNVYCSEVMNPSVDWTGITNSSYNATTMLFVSQTIQLNASKTSTWNNNGALQSVAIHEFGHSLGLAEYPNAAVIMNPYTPGTNSRYGTYGITTIQSDDRNCANARY